VEENGRLGYWKDVSDKREIAVIFIYKFDGAINNVTKRNRTGTETVAYRDHTKRHQPINA
jgi:hypothetical protein